MSLKRMITKLALAFAAKKGMELFRSAGGIEGLKRSMTANAVPAGGGRGGMVGRIGGATDASTDGLGNLLGSLGLAEATGAREAGVTGQLGSQSIGGLFSTLASALGGQAGQAPSASGPNLQDELDFNDIEDTSTAGPMIRAMVQMARADGKIDEAEQSALMSFFDDATQEERRLLQDALTEPVDAGAIAADTPSDARKEVYAAALLVGDPENGHERTFLQNLAEALELETAQTGVLHQAMGKRVIPA
ncbi:uncharacterized membrane protein YebE (DUF533 family) [Aliiruegeria haliotis]|uniref:Uncharacterized membrane protein YebE (DUF533 family) n=1 Tax=Aliiruegeria haliotis TaxID=1280846 RepID=A0A2T0RLU9_9RHOB|nr:tellurite resistance TerB family protein [Aliiruegeria haliotis]PRY22148.1 uncharacterized membrane protein YebE (DUF533 family) [Aliiruegeria haliotis]